MFLVCHDTVEPRYNEVLRDWHNLFAITRFRYIEVVFHIFYYYWGEENRSSYRGLRYIEVRYIEVPLYNILVQHACNGRAWLTSECSPRYDNFV